MSFILLVKHVFSLISLILVCKALQRLCINAFLCYFYGISRVPLHLCATIFLAVNMADDTVKI